jgi:SAM-dependent methyltransferase
MKLNIGAGHRKMSGYVSVDVDPSTSPDIVAEAWSLTLIPDNSVEEVLAVHVLEHFYPWDGEKALTEWIRVLRPGGRLVLELPDFVKCCINIAESRKARKHPDLLGLFGLYGDERTKNPHMMHKWGYSPETLLGKLRAAGYQPVRREAPVFHKLGREFRDMRFVAYKPEM